MRTLRLALGLAFGLMVLTVASGAWAGRVYGVMPGLGHPSGRVYGIMPGNASSPASNTTEAVTPGRVTGTMPGLPAQATPASSQETAGTQDNAYVVMNVTADPSKCSPASAENVDFRTFLAAPDAFLFKCIAVKGYYRSRAIFLDPDDLGDKRASSNSGDASRRAGLYSPDSVWKRLHNMDLTYIEVTGIANTCENLDGPQVVMLMGYCHYADGPIIEVVAIKPTREPLKDGEE